MSTVHVNSNAGGILMKHARLLQDGQDQEMEKEQENNGNHQEYSYDVDVDVSWMKDFSIKFLGCHHVASWNSNAQEDNDVKIQTQRFVRFRLCQTDSCSDKNSLGCSSGYGDYVVDMDTFVSAHVENLRSTSTTGANYYYDSDAQANLGFLGQYSQCSQYGNGENRRQLEEKNEVEYFIGPYCSSQGQDIHLGLFTDDTCTEFADSNAGIATYKEMTGSLLPYSKADSTSVVVDGTCHSCAQDSNSYYDGNGQSSYIKESCQNVYVPSGKCENRLSKFMSSISSTTDLNNYGCKYIDGIRFTPALSSGVIHRNRFGWVVSLFLALFVISFILLMCYIVYLKLELAKQKRTEKRNKSFMTESNGSPIKKYFERRRSKSRSQSRDGRNNRNANDEGNHNRRRLFGFFGRKKKKKDKAKAKANDNRTSLLS